MRHSLPPTVSIYLDTLRRPRLLFASILDGSALASALMWVVMLGILAGVTGVYAALQGKTGLGQDWWRDFPMKRAVFFSVWFCLTDVLWATLLTWALARLARETLRFDSLLTVLCLASAPCLLTTLTFPMRDLSWTALHVWQGLNIFVIVWVSILICMGVQACLNTSLGKAAQCSLPALLILWAIGVRAHKAPPTNFRAACRWEQWEGRHVRLFMLPGKSPKEVSLLAQGLDELTEKDDAALGESSLPFKIDFFCFDDDLQQRHFAGSAEEPTDTAHTFFDCVTFSYDTWENLRPQMAHEICHVILANRLTDKVHGLLDEGLCEYVAHTVTADPDALSPTPATALPLRVLARPEVFFDWDLLHEKGVEDEEADWKHYRAAESLTAYLIKRSGMAKFKNLYCRYALHGRDNDPDNDEGKQLAHAVQDVYGISLAELEHQWRADAVSAILPDPLPAPSDLQPSHSSGS